MPFFEMFLPDDSRLYCLAPYFLGASGTFSAGFSGAGGAGAGAGAGFGSSFITGFSGSLGLHPIPMAVRLMTRTKASMRKIHFFIHFTSFPYSLSPLSKLGFHRRVAPLRRSAPVRRCKGRGGTIFYLALRRAGTIGSEKTPSASLPRATIPWPWNGGIVSSSLR